MPPSFNFAFVRKYEWAIKPDVFLREVHYLFVELTGL
jgi:hypothetical protein